MATFEELMAQEEQRKELEAKQKTELAAKRKAAKVEKTVKPPREDGTVPRTLAIARGLLSLSGAKFSNTAMGTKTKAEGLVKSRFANPNHLGTFLKNLGQYLEQI